ncbi:hypothetical protein QJS10_CPB15g00981 [Acorus calamus]|uniref:DUF4283 domain-containing protein n=1 Tax=Acorus calamus TaxID=4465 RepID=A0AAV9D556_ACOCL|nr:hypothetical protein QJS10_CPB15g00981 [Acorus calamus]
MDENRPIVEVKEADYIGSVAQWGKDLVGYIIGTTLVYTPFLQFLKRLWKPKEDLQEVLEGGPWTMASCPFIIQQWSPHACMELERLTSIPIWVKFLDLPLHMWSLGCLSKIASGIGKPLPDSIMVNSKIGGQQEFKVVYDWKPRACSHCNTFGHDDAMCCKRPNKSSATTVVDKGKQEVQRTKKQQGTPLTNQPASTTTANENQFALLQTTEDSNFILDAFEVQQIDDTIPTKETEAMIAVATETHVTA